MSATPQAAEAITAHRERLGLSKRRLSRMSNVSAPYITQLENGTRPVTPKVLAQLADTFHVPRYQLLAEGSFIPANAVVEAEDMATQAMSVPEIAKTARGNTPDARWMWLVCDYLYMLGYDSYGDGYEGGPGGNAADWTPLLPDAPEPLPARASRELTAWRAAQARDAPPHIEGWDDLTSSDRKIVQQLVNHLRKSSGKG